YRAIERPGDNRCRGDRWGVCTIRESARSAASCAAYHFIRNLQQVMNCFGFERWMFPELQQMRAANAPVPEFYQLFEHRSRHIMGNPRQLRFACIDVDRRPCEN